MTLCVVSMFKNEEDVAGPWVQHYLDEQVDGIIVADNLSTDRTREILDGFNDSRLMVVDDDDPAYMQASKMTQLSRLAHDMGATWILPADADEWFFAGLGPLGDVLNDDTSVDIVETYGFDHRPTSSDDPTETNPFRRMVWREPAPQRLPKVAFRWREDAELRLGNHNVMMPGRRGGAGLLSMRHFGYRSFEQMCRKVRQGAAAADAASLPRLEMAHWRQYAALDDEALRVEWEQFFDMPGLVHDPCPL